MYYNGESSWTADKTLKSRVVAVLLRKHHVSEDEVQDFVSQIKERHMSDLFANFKATVNVQEERRIGREQGLGIGEEIKLIRQVCGKIGLGQSIEQIATDLLEDEEHIRRISQIVSKHAPDYNADKIYEELYNFDQKQKSEFVKNQ